MSTSKRRPRPSLSPRWTGAKSLVGTYRQHASLDHWAQEIQRVNPFLNDEQVQTTLDLAVALMLTVNRLSQLARCISLAQDLLP